MMQPCAGRIDSDGRRPCRSQAVGPGRSRVATRPSGAPVPTAISRSPRSAAPPRGSGDVGLLDPVLALGPAIPAIAAREVRPPAPGSGEPEFRLGGGRKGHGDSVWREPLLERFQARTATSPISADPHLLGRSPAPVHMIVTGTGHDPFAATHSSPLGNTRETGRRKVGDTYLSHDRYRRVTDQKACHALVSQHCRTTR